MHILTVVNGSNPSARDASLLLEAYLSSQGIKTTTLFSSDIPSLETLATQRDQALRHADIQPFDMAVALGGDGTILRTGRLAVLFDAPVMGINFGHLGFLANPSEQGVIPMVAAALAGDVTEDKRTCLQVTVQCEGQGEEQGEAAGARAFGNGTGAGARAFGAGAGAGARAFGAGAAAGARAFGAGAGAGAAYTTHEFTALNEVTIARGSCPRNLELHLGISGEDLCTLQGDGLIVATATGSTAYALAAGGPLVSPGVEGMVVVPLASHTLQSRAIVTQRHDVVETCFDFAEGYTFAEVQLDGAALSFPAPVKRVLVRCSPTPARLLFYKKESFYARIARTFF